MSTVLAILVLTALLAAVAARLEANHRRTRGRPWALAAPDRDAQRVAHDLTAAGSRRDAPARPDPAAVVGAGRAPRAPGSRTGRRPVAPSARAA